MKNMLLYNMKSFAAHLGYILLVFSKSPTYLLRPVSAVVVVEERLLVVGSAGGFAVHVLYIAKHIIQALERCS